MKKTICTLLILLLVMGACVGAFACKASIQTDKAYQRYVYDARTDSFVKMGTSIVFTDDFKGFEYSFGGDAITIYGTVEHTEMAHIFKRTDEGLTLISRFWLGQTLKNPLLRKAMLTDATARGMAAHCCVEYRSLAGILPELYDQKDR